MRILHTSDWHIGRTLNEKSLLEDQRAALDDFLKTVREVHPEVIVIAGDLYDRSVPSKEAMTLVDQVLSELILKIGVPVMIISGNHDGRERLAFSGGILKEQGLYLAGTYPDELTAITLLDDYGEVDFWLVPFIRPVEYRSQFKKPKILDYEAMYADIIAGIQAKMVPGRRNVLVTHGLILGGVKDLETIDDSVRPIEIGGVDFARSALFESFNYTALGHLHRPQKAGLEKIRYAGSLLKYSFSEWQQKKSLTLIDLDGAGQTAVQMLPIHPLRDLRVVRGSLEALTDVSVYAEEGREDYLKVILTDEARLINPMEKLRQVYPGVLEMSYEKTAMSGAGQRRAAVKERIQDPMALFEEFYSFIHDEALPPAEKEMFAALLTEIHEEEVR